MSSPSRPARAGDAAPIETDTAARAWGLLSLRLGLILVVTLVMWLIIRATSGVDSFPPNTMWATLGLLPVNVICLLVVRKLYREQGLTLGAALGIRKGRVGRDVLWGVLWLVVLNIPFAVAVSGTVFALYGSDAPAAFETIFFDPASSVPMPPAILLIISLVAIVPFMLINAPTEELLFRGYGLNGIASRWGGVAAIIATSLLFGAQHVFFAASAPGMLVYFVAFTLWGLCAAIIVRKQGRLFPVVIAHWIVNISLSAPVIALPILQLTGVIPAP